MSTARRPTHAEAVHQVDLWRESLLVLARQLPASLDDEAVTLVAFASMTDAMSLLDSVLAHNGRPAACAARSLFDDVLNLGDLRMHPELSSDYLAYEAESLLIRATRDEYLKWLPRADADRERRLLKNRLREAEERGASMKPARAEWRRVDRRTRAEALGLGHMYDGYKLLCAAVHGSAGGTETARTRARGVRVFLVGRDSELAWVAFTEGLPLIEIMATHLSELSGLASARELRDRSIQLRGIAPALLHSVRREREAAAERARGGIELDSALVAWPSGILKWFHVDRRAGTFQRGNLRVGDSSNAKAAAAVLVPLARQRGQATYAFVPHVRLDTSPGASVADLTLLPGTEVELLWDGITQPKYR